MGYYLQKLAAEAAAAAGKPTVWEQVKGGLTKAKDKVSAFGTSVKDTAADIGRTVKDKVVSGAGYVKDKAVAGGRYVKNKGAAAGKYVSESKPGQWVKNNPKKAIGGAAATAAVLGLVAGRNKIKKALGYGESEE